jgi:hypothetical protein
MYVFRLERIKIALDSNMEQTATPLTLIPPPKGNGIYTNFDGR